MELSRDRLSMEEEVVEKVKERKIWGLSCEPPLSKGKSMITFAISTKPGIVSDKYILIIEGIDTNINNSRSGSINEIRDILLEQAKRLENLEKVNKHKGSSFESWQAEEEFRNRLEKLENLSNFKKLESCIFEGALTHASILKCESRLNELETTMEMNRVGLNNLIEVNVNNIWDKFNALLDKLKVLGS